MNGSAPNSYVGVANGDSPFAQQHNANVMDEFSMTSPEAAAARARAAEIMEALKNGESVKAEKMMGDRKYGGTDQLLPGKGLLQRMLGKKKKTAEDEKNLTDDTDSEIVR